MKNLRKLLVLLLAICMVLPFAAACAGDNDGDLCTHDNEVICNECGEIVLGDAYYANMLKSSTAALAKGKGVNVEVEGSFSVDVDEETGTHYYEKTDGNYGELIIASVDATVNATAITGFKSDGKIYAEGSMSVVLNMKDATGTTVIVNSIIVDAVKVENNVASYNMARKVVYPTFNAAEKDLNEIDLQQNGSANITDVDWIAQTVEVMPIILDVYGETILPYIDGIITTNSEDVNAAIATVLDGLCTVSKEGENNVFTMTKLGANLKQLPVLADKDISVVFDDLFGKGAYNNLPRMMDALLNTKLGDFLALLEEKGIEIDELVAVADEVCKAIYGDDEATLEALIGVDIASTIDCLDKTKTIKQLLTTVGGVTEEEIAQVLEEAEAILIEYKDKSIYEIFTLIEGDEITQQDKAMIKDVVNKAADFVDEAFDVKLVADKNGKLVSCGYGINLDGSSDASQALIGTIMSIVGAQSQDEGVANTIYAVSSIKGNLNCKTSFVSIA